MTFAVPNHVTTLTAYEHCNLHGLWTTSALTPAWERRAAALLAAQGGLAFNSTFFGDSGKTSGAGHQPTLRDGGDRTVVVAVPHGMSKAHHITALWARDQTGKVALWEDLSADAAAARGTFAVGEGVTALLPYEDCNLHGTWHAAAVVWCGVAVWRALWPTFASMPAAPAPRPHHEADHGRLTDCVRS